MRWLITGGRHFADGAKLCAILDANLRPGDTIINGGAQGADLLSTIYARASGLTHWVFPADWANHGRAAGPKRNRRMLIEGKPDAVIAFAGGVGTAHMCRIARDAGIPVHEIQADA